MADSSKPEPLPGTHGDAGLIVAKALVSAIPFVGGSLAALVEFVPTAKERNTKKAIGFFQEKITALENRVDTDAVDKDEFAELFTSCVEVMARTHRDEKLHAAANILANLLLKQGDHARVSYDELDHLIRCVDALSIGAMSMLGAIREVSETRPLGPHQEAIQFGQLRSRLQMDVHLLKSLVSELQGFNLVHVQEVPLRGYAEAEYDGDHLSMSPIGRRLSEQFIEGKM